MLTASEYEEWATQAAKELFKEKIDRFEDEDLKAFAEEHFDLITGDNK